MHTWKVKILPFRSRTYDDAKEKAQDLLQAIQGKSKRKLCIRSKYFHKQKIFFDYFWDHLRQKPIAQRKTSLDQRVVLSNFIFPTVLAMFEVYSRRHDQRFFCVVFAERQAEQ